jgi:hypothetical protein
MSRTTPATSENRLLQQPKKDIVATINIIY